jgi:hypothetical protein
MCLQLIFSLELDPTMGGLPLLLGDRHDPYDDCH